MKLSIESKVAIAVAAASLRWQSASWPRGVVEAEPGARTGTGRWIIRGWVTWALRVCKAPSSVAQLRKMREPNSQTQTRMKRPSRRRQKEKQQDTKICDAEACKHPRKFRRLSLQITRTDRCWILRAGTPMEFFLQRRACLPPKSNQRDWDSYDYAAFFLVGVIFGNGTTCADSAPPFWPKVDS